jgi:hypothetical protein
MQVIYSCPSEAYYTVEGPEGVVPFMRPSVNSKFAGTRARALARDLGGAFAAVGGRGCSGPV